MAPYGLGDDTQRSIALGFAAMIWTVPPFTRQTRKRADRDHARKKLAKKQKQHLRSIKSQGEIRKIVLGSRHLAQQ